jgi:O-antigen/teichoic acid export membrane protein
MMFLVNIIKFGSIIMISRQLSINEIGVWGQIQVINSLLPLIIIMRLEVSFVRYLIKESQRNIGNLIVLAVTILAFISIIIAIFSLIFSDTISYIIFASYDYGKLLILIIYLVSVRAFYELIKSVLRSKEDVFKSSLIDLIDSVVLMLSAILFSFNGYGIHYFICIWAFLHTIHVIFSYLYIRAELRINLSIIKESFSIIIKYIKFSLPLVANRVLNWSVQHIDKFIITYFLGLEFTGGYYLAFMLTSLISNFVSPLHFVLFPRVSKYWNMGKQERAIHLLRVSAYSILLVTFPISLFLSWNAEVIGKYIFNNKLIDEHVLYFLAISVTVDQISAILRHFIFLTENTKLMLRFSLITSLVVLPLVYLFTYQYSITGAAFARLIGALILLFFLSFEAVKNYKTFFLKRREVTLCSILFIINLIVLHFDVDITICVVITIILIPIYLYAVFKAYHAIILPHLNN